MESEDGSVVVVFNGEIYNYKQLTAELREQGFTFRSTSDTEVLVHGYRAWGSDIFKKIDGMWAIALYDKRAGTLFLSRDPAGIKPLYVHQKGSELLFASEIPALQKVLSQEALAVDDASMVQFLAHGYIYSNTTIYRGIHEVPCATTLTFNLASRASTSECQYILARRSAPASMEEAVTQFDALFRESVRESLQSDVPVSLFLSGGIDSSLVGYYAKESGTSLHAFTIGFEQASFDESDTAARIAAHLGFPHTTHVLKASDIANDIESIFDAFGEPFADASAVPTYYVSKLARAEGYKVALAGDGADELFGGYPTHYLPPVARLYKKTPRVFDTLLKKTAGAFAFSAFAKLGTREKIERFLLGARRPYQEAHAHWKRVFSEDELKRLLVPRYLSHISEMDVGFSTLFKRVAGGDEANEIMQVDFLSFLTANCLVKSDICAMQHGVEVRVPFLNKRVIDFAWNLPSRFKTRPFETKRLLRKALARSLPSAFTRLPKQGFTPPISLWLCGELKPIMLSMLSEQNVAAAGFLNQAYVTTLIEEHLAGMHDHGKKLWSLMSLAHFFSSDTLSP